MDYSLASKLSSAIAKVQALVGESATINQITYPCIIGIENTRQELGEGGWKPISTCSISINLTDILCSPVAPVFGNTVLLLPRNRTYRVNGITPTQTTWELELIDVTA